MILATMRGEGRNTRREKSSEKKYPKSNRPSWRRKRMDHF